MGEVWDSLFKTSHLEHECVAGQLFLPQSESKEKLASSPPNDHHAFHVFSCHIHVIVPSTRESLFMKILSSSPVIMYHEKRREITRQKQPVSPAIHLVTVFFLPLGI